MIVWLRDIPPDEYVRCTPSRGLTTAGQLRRMSRQKGRTIIVGFEVEPYPRDKRYLVLVRYFWLTSRDHFFGGAGHKADEWWSSPDNMPSEGIRVRDIHP